MYKLYLVTGATGFLGSTIIKKLLKIGASVRALVMPGDKLAKNIPEDVEIAYGSVSDPNSLEDFFNGAGNGDCLIHCAGVISIASVNDEKLWNVNVIGTANIVNMCIQHKISRLVHVSSVHAIPEKNKGEIIRECSSFSPDNVVGAYAKSKAAATACVLNAVKTGLNAVVAHPSGIIGPYDIGGGSITETILSYCNGKLSAGVTGGYDFVDVRDVADGVIACCHKGKMGECYILSNRYVSVKEILETLKKLIHGKRILLYAPLSIVKMFAPLCEKFSIRKNRPLFLTPYSVYTMGSNAVFSHEKATNELGYSPRETEKTLSDMVKWLMVTGKIKFSQGCSLNIKTLGRRKFIKNN